MEQTTTRKRQHQTKTSIYSLQLHELKEWLVECEKAFRAEQIFDWLYRKEYHNI